MDQHTKPYRQQQYSLRAATQAALWVWWPRVRTVQDPIPSVGRFTSGNWPMDCFLSSRTFSAQRAYHDTLPLSSLDFACTKKSDSKFGMASCAVSYSQSCSAFSPPRPPINLCLDSSNPAQRLIGIFHVKNHMEVFVSSCLVLYCRKCILPFACWATPVPIWFRTWPCRVAKTPA